MPASKKGPQAPCSRSTLALRSKYSKDSKAMTPLGKMAKLSQQKKVTLIGLMSGTSADGVDACLVTFTKGAKVQWQLREAQYFPFKKSLRQKILQVAAKEGRVEDACRLDVELGQAYAKAVSGLLKKAKVKDVAAVASHGQTIRHLPPRGKKLGATMQIGQAAIIAQETGLPVISDFRVADMALGGHGAPLVPQADKLLFAQKGKTVAIQNIGGMANITVLQGEKPPCAFDTGPGNALLDLAVAHYFQGRKQCDLGGKLAARGCRISSLFKWLMDHPFLKKKPPKSTGREAFGEEFWQEVLARAEGAKANDVIRTLTDFTAASIAGAMKFVQKPDIFYVAGGGAKNETLMDELQRRLSMKVEPLGDLADWREALCFAALGYLFLRGSAGAEPLVTGAAGPAILGKLSLPPQWVRKN